MWFIPTKKEVKKEFDKIGIAFKERDDKINKLKEKVEDNTLKIATLEGAYSILSNKSQQSQSQDSLKIVSGKSQANFETKLIQRIRNNKKSLVMAEIMKLLHSHTTQDIFDIIVLQKGLCSKASFYRYLSSLKSQKLIETDTITETNKGR